MTEDVAAAQVAEILAQIGPDARKRIISAAMMQTIEIDNFGYSDALRAQTASPQETAGLGTQELSVYA